MGKFLLRFCNLALTYQYNETHYQSALIGVIVATTIVRIQTLAVSSSGVSSDLALIVYEHYMERSRYKGTSIKYYMPYPNIKGGTR